MIFNLLLNQLIFQNIKFSLAKQIQLAEKSKSFKDFASSSETRETYKNKTLFTKQY